MNDSIPYSPQMPSPLTPWSDAHSTFNDSPYLDSSRAGSSTSLWTASSASSVMEPEDDVSSELRCLELLAELEREKRRKSAEAKRVQRNSLGEGYGQHSRDDSFPDVVQPLNLDKARAARNAKYSNETKSHSAPSIKSLSGQTAQRVPRRASFTTTDLAELDIDAILDAYCSDALATPSTNEEYFSHQPLTRSKQSYDLQSKMKSPPPQSALPQPPSLHRNSTAYSIRSTRSNHSSGSTTVAKTDRRAGPFPTITRQRSNASLASRKLPFDATSAPPLPPSTQYPHPTSVPMSNRTFSSFSRQSTASNASSSSAHSLPLRALPGPPPTLPLPAGSSRMSCASSTMSRQTSSASTNNSFRWSVATSSTVPTLVSDGSSDCGASRRGSIAPSSVGSFKQISPSRSRRRPSAPFPGSPIEQDEDDRFFSRRGSSTGRDNYDEREEEEEEELKESGLISWEDFADELANLPVPSRPNPRRMNSQGSNHSSRSRRHQHQHQNGSSSPFPPPQYSPSNIFNSPESLRSTATLTSINSSSKSTSPFPSSSPSISPTNSRSGKKIGGFLRSKKSTRELVSAFA